MQRLRLPLLALATSALLLILPAAVSAEDGELSCKVVDGIYTCEMTVTAPAPTEEEQMRDYCEETCFSSNPMPGGWCTDCYDRYWYWF